MFANSKAFSGFAVDDLQQAQAFYGETLGLKTSLIPEAGDMLTLHLADRDTLVYEKSDLGPANYTILNFPWRTSTPRSTTSPLGASRSSATRGSSRTKGIARGQGPAIAWFEDPRKSDICRAGAVLEPLRLPRPRARR